MLNKKEIRQKDIVELKTELENTKKELFKMHCRQVTDVVQTHTQIREIKKNIALLNTIIREKEIQSTNQKKATAEKKA